MSDARRLVIGYTDYSDDDLHAVFDNIEITVCKGSDFAGQSNAPVEVVIHGVERSLDTEVMLGLTNSQALKLVSDLIKAAL